MSKRSSSLAKACMTIVFSQIGLCALVVLYCVAGGYIFEHLEKENERIACFEAQIEYSSMENSTIDEILTISGKYEGMADKMLMTAELGGVLKLYRDNSLSINYDGTDCGMMGYLDGPPHKWSWSGALYFSVTVISTIGYGHISPKTVWGRLVCMAYALTGIPLMLLCLAQIGDVVADIVRFIYRNIIYLGCCRSQRTRVTKAKIPAPNESSMTAWGKPRNSCPTDTDATSRTRRTTTSYTGDRKKRVSFENKVFQSALELQEGLKRVNDEHALNSSDKESGTTNLDDITQVPLTITMIIIASYIASGAVLFGLWEDWDMLQASYFCFVTLSTIGFGDVVPGTDLDNPKVQIQMMIGAVYLLFGLVMVSMAFTLMQVTITSKSKWIGKKLGLLDDTDDD